MAVQLSDESLRDVYKLDEMAATFNANPDFRAKFFAARGRDATWRDFLHSDPDKTAVTIMSEYLAACLPARIAKITPK